MDNTHWVSAVACIFVSMAWFSPRPASALPPLVPGHGVKIAKVGDDFEDPDWRYDFNGPKSSSNIDEQTREPIGISKNKRIFESTYRGHPDIVQRVKTPAGGIAGSRGALLLRSRATGIPGRTSHDQQQDDLLVNVYGKLGHEIAPKYAPSCTVRVYVPQCDQWEQRSGSSFGFRLDCEAYGIAPTEGIWLTRKKKGWHQYWPGMFFLLRRKQDGYDRNHVQVLIRADRNGHDIEGPTLSEPGWYTLGMSITADGRVHYFLRPGVEGLTPEDHIASHFPYGLECDKLNLLFFNVVNVDDGQTWSTPWIVDDPSVYYVPKGWSLADVQRYNQQHASARTEDTTSSGGEIVLVDFAEQAKTSTMTVSTTSARPLSRKRIVLRR